MLHKRSVGCWKTFFVCSTANEVAVTYIVAFLVRLRAAVPEGRHFDVHSPTDGDRADLRQTSSMIGWRKAHTSVSASYSASTKFDARRCCTSTIANTVLACLIRLHSIAGASCFSISAASTAVNETKENREDPDQLTREQKSVHEIERRRQADHKSKHRHSSRDKSASRKQIPTIWTHSEIWLSDV